MKITQICFPTLEKLSSDPKGSSGHYWLVVLNIKARRFEILDSLASKTEALLRVHDKQTRKFVGASWNLFKSI